MVSSFYVPLKTEKAASYVFVVCSIYRQRGRLCRAPTIIKLEPSMLRAVGAALMDHLTNIMAPSVLQTIHEVCPLILLSEILMLY